MSERNLRRLLTNRRRSRAPTPGGRTPTHRRSSKHEKFLQVLKRSFSEPALLSLSVSGNGNADDECSYRRSDSDLALFRPGTFADVFASSPSLLPSSPLNFQESSYNRDAKVVVTVTVEGSPGPIRAMVKLGSSVEETIKHVLNRYGKEGRTPKLDNNTSSFELHCSYFSLESLEKSKVIGDIGSRSFYLRRRNTDKSDSSLDIVRQRSTSPPPQQLPPVFLVPTLIAKKFGKIERRARKLWKILICSQ